MPRLSKIGAAALAAFGWTSGSSVTATYLVVGGGGGGAPNGRSGAGAGGYLTGTSSLLLSTSYAITVGAGGTSATNGNNSVFNTFTSYGGGGSVLDASVGASGGSGSGGGTHYANAGGAGTAGQGNNGGVGGAYSGAYGTGGGGGAGAVGGAGSSTLGAGDGGVGLASSITGSSVYYAGGGGGSADTTHGGVGGTGGGGNGGLGGSNATSGTANTGGGAGGGYTGASNGGSGIVIISYAAPQKFGGGVVTTNGSNIVHTFTTSGTLTPLASLTASYLIVAGGGAGGGAINNDVGGAGGGAGGLVTGSSLTIDTNSIYNVIVGAGGAINTYAYGGNGGNSSFSIVSTSAVGGGGGGGGIIGGGGNSTTASRAGVAGGSGGGATYSSVYGAGTSGQGNNGGTDPTGQAGTGGGGGGAGAVGANTISTGFNIGSGGNGGVGLTSSIIPYANAQSLGVGQVVSTSVYFAGGGGGGGGYSATGGPSGTGGYGGGGAGGPTFESNGFSASAYTGGGGGGAWVGVSKNGGNGGSGLVIISYSGSTQLMAGGQVIISGGNVIHVFTSSGSLTPLKSINNSLRFRSSNSAYLSRTFASTPTSWTASFWVKRGQLGSIQTIFGSRLSGTGSAYVEFLSNDTFGVANNNTSVATNAVYRDPSAWYHFTVNWTSGNSVSIYCNGVLQSVTGSISGANQIFTSGWTNTIGRYGDSASQYLDGYLADVYFIDGQVLTPSSFGSTNSYGVWQPTYYGGSYGTNGFYLTFSNTTSTTTLGYDYSSNGNNWTTYNISLTAGSTYDAMIDSPTLSASASNYAVFNPIGGVSNPSTITNGNLNVTTPVTGVGTTVSTIQIPSLGQYYCEITFVTDGAAGQIGIVDFATINTNFPLSPNCVSYASSSGVKFVDGSSSSYGSSYTTGDIIGLAINANTGSITFYKNNTSQGAITHAVAGLVIAVCDGSNGAGGSVFAGNFGQQPFTYTPPSGYNALNTYNLPTPTIAQGNKYMDATLWNGGQTSPFNVYNAGSFQPDFVWAKERSSAGSSRLYDVIRGTGVSLSSNSTGAEGTETNPGVSSFNSNGFTITNTYSPSVAPYLNDTSQTYVGWNWKAGGTAVSNTAGSITSSVSANTTSGFSIVTYTGTGANATVGHGIGIAPSFIVVKRRDAGSDWNCYHISLGASQYIQMDSTGAAATNTGVWNNTAPTTSVFSIGTAFAGINTSGGTDVAYCFAPVAGFSAFGSYTGNGSATGPFIYTGFQPKYLLVKRTDSTSDWYIWDSVRNTFNIVTNTLLADTSGAETSASSVNILSNGFQCVSSTVVNVSTGTYIYAAFASNPFKYTNAF